MAKDLEWRIVIRDDGTAVVKRVAAEVKKAQQDILTSQATADSKLVSGTKSINDQMVEIQKQAAASAEDITKRYDASRMEALKKLEEQSGKMTGGTVEEQRKKMEELAAAFNASIKQVDVVKATKAVEAVSGELAAKQRASYEEATLAAEKSAKARSAAESNLVTAQKRYLAESSEANKKGLDDAEVAYKKAAKAQESSDTKALSSKKRMTEANESYLKSQIRTQNAQKQLADDVERVGKSGTEGIIAQTKEASNLERIVQRVQRTMVAFMAVWAFRQLTEGFQNLVKQGLEFNAVMEESRLGIASIFMAQGSFVSSSGRALEGTEALNAALQMSSKITQELQIDNLRTAATYQQLVKAYQQTVAPGMAAGFDPEQIRKYTVAMVQAASAMGLNLDMLGEETRSMLRGTITPRNTLIATALGIRNEDITKYKGDIEGLYSFVMGRLSSFAVAGEVVATTWRGAMSNVKDVIQMTLGVGFTNLFEYIKREALSIQNAMVKWDVKGPSIDKDIVGVISSVGEAIIQIIEGTKVWLGALSGIGPIIGLIYQLLRSVMIAINPWVELFGKVLSLVGHIASGISKVVEGINNLITSTKEFQAIWAMVIGLILTGLIGNLLPGLTLTLVKMGALVISTASWSIPLVVAAGMIQTITTSLEGMTTLAKVLRLVFMGIGAAILYMFSPLWGVLGIALLLVEVVRQLVTFLTSIPSVMNWSKGLTNVLGAEYGLYMEVEDTNKITEDVRVAISKGIKEGTKESPMVRIMLELDERTKNDTQRWINEVLGGKGANSPAKSIAEQYTNAFKSIEAFEGGAITYTPRQIKLDQSQQDELLKLRTSLGEIGDEEKDLILAMNSAVPLQSKLNELSARELVIVAKIAQERAKSTLGKEFDDLYSRLADLQVLKDRLATQDTTLGIYKSIASQNKNYQEQIRITRELLSVKLQTLAVEHKLTPELQAAEEAKSKSEIVVLSRQATSEMISYKEEATNALAQMLSMTGNIEEQIKYERTALDLGIQKRKVNLDLRGEQGKITEELIRQRFEADAVKRIEQDRLDYASRISSQLMETSQITGDYQSQAKYLEESNRIQIRNLELTGKLYGEEGAKLKTLIEQNNLYKEQDVIIQGITDHRRQILEIQSRLAEALSDFKLSLAVEKMKVDLDLEPLNLKLARLIEIAKKGIVIKIAPSSSEFSEETGYPMSKESTVTSIETIKAIRRVREAISGITNVAGAELGKKSTESLDAYLSKISELEMSIADLTGNEEDYQTALSVSIGLENSRIGRDPNLNADRYREVIGLLKQYNDLQKQIREFDKKSTGLKIQSEIAGQYGTWENVKQIEKEMLTLEYERQKAVGGLTNEARRYAEIMYNLKMSEVEAQRTMNVERLTEIGLIRGSMTASQELASTIQEFLPDAINAAGDAMSTFMADIISGTKTIKDAFKNMMSALSQSFTRLIADMVVAWAKAGLMQYLALGSTTTAVSSGVGGSVGSGVTLMAEGGKAAKNMPFIIGERGPELFVPDVAGQIIPFKGTAISRIDQVKSLLSEYYGEGNKTTENTQSKLAEMARSSDQITRASSATLTDKSTIENAYNANNVVYLEDFRSKVSEIVKSNLTRGVSSTTDNVVSLDEVRSRISSSVSNVVKSNINIEDMAKKLGIPALASGGSAKGGSYHLVGEKGPELFVPDTSGIIIPNHLLDKNILKMAAGGSVFGGSTYLVGEKGPELYTTGSPEKVFNNIINSRQDINIDINIPTIVEKGTGEGVEESNLNSNNAKTREIMRGLGGKIKLAVAEVIMEQKRSGGLLSGR